MGDSMGTSNLRSALRFDPRLWQIASLSALVIDGLTRLDFALSPAQIAVTLATALIAQWALARLTGAARFEPRSALISALSLCLLLRTSDLRVAALASVIAIGSKFAIRVRGKHVFNPTNLALIAVIALTGRAWVSPAQWGNFAFFAFLMACIGLLVVHRAARSDVTLAFLAAYAALLFARAHWLGQRAAVPLHQLENGALLLFAFFMISDPRTTPDSRAGRVLFGTLVAIGALSVTFLLYRPNGLLWSLAALSPLVPLIDRVLPGVRHVWPSPTSAPRLSREEKRHEALDSADRARPAAAVSRA
jgi:enediyne biosynthesis protein E5